MLTLFSLFDSLDQFTVGWDNSLFCIEYEALIQPNTNLSLQDNC